MASDPNPASSPLDQLSVEHRDALLGAAPNFRDVGGWPTVSATMRTGVMYRTDHLASLPAAAQTALTHLEVTEVYDLRTDAERTPAPDALPSTIALQIADVLADRPDSGAAQVAALGAALAGGDGTAMATINAAIGDGKAADFMIETYRDFIRLPSANQAYASFLRGVAHGSSAIAFHCTAGKDRTGWAAAITQMFVGVDDAIIIREYLASNELTSAMFTPMLAAFRTAGGDAESLATVMQVRSEYLEAAVSLMTSTYGDVEGYLRQGLGLQDEDLAALQHRLVG